jgi:hypothetical protein
MDSHQVVSCFRWVEALPRPTCISAWPTSLARHVSGGDCLVLALPAGKCAVDVCVLALRVEYELFGTIKRIAKGCY